MTIIKNLIEYSDEFIQSYEDWYYENHQDDTLLWEYHNLLEYFKKRSKSKIHYLVCHQHVTIDDLKNNIVKYFTGEDCYKDALKFLYNLDKEGYDLNEEFYHDYDIYPYSY